jgi:hypothetical protein
MSGDNQAFVLKESSAAYDVVTDGDVDVSLLKANLTKTPWERMQANDDALNFAASLRMAMEKRNAKFK